MNIWKEGRGLFLRDYISNSFPSSLYCSDNTYFQFIKNKQTHQPGYYHALFLRMTEATGLHNFHTAKLSFCLQKTGQCRSLSMRSPACGFPHTPHTNWTLTNSLLPASSPCFVFFQQGWLLSTTLSTLTQWSLLAASLTLNQCVPLHFTVSFPPAFIMLQLASG